MNLNTYDSQLQVETSPEGEVISLRDRKFSWRERKEKTMLLHELYQKAGYLDYAERTKNCATTLQFAVMKSGERRLMSANFCKLRLCPMCISRRARRNAWKLSQVLNQVEAEHDARFLFLTLTMKNVDGPELGSAISQLTRAWNMFLKQRQIERSVKGWFRAVEITRGDDRWHTDKKTGRRKYRKDEGYHPHIHAILAVEPDYFSRESRQSGKYLNQCDLVTRWQKALRADYKPSVSIETAKAKGEYGAGRKAAVEAAKYAVKDEEYIDPTLPEARAVEIVRDYTEALYRRRLTAFGGWLKDAAKVLDADDLDDGDLVHTDDDAIREDLVEMIEQFNWHFGAGDFILSGHVINPFAGTYKESRLEEIEKRKE